MATETVSAPVPVPVPTPGMFDSIDWKSPVPGVLKVAAHLQSLDMMSAAERLTLLQGGLLHVIGTSTMTDEEKDAARAFVTTMLPHVVETAVVTLQANAKIAALERKAEEVLSKQPEIVVESIEAVIAEARKRKWWCF